MGIRLKVELIRYEPECDDDAFSPDDVRLLNDVADLDPFQDTPDLPGHNPILEAYESRNGAYQDFVDSLDDFIKDEGW